MVINKLVSWIGGEICVVRRIRIGINKRLGGWICFLLNVNWISCFFFGVIVVICNWGFCVLEVFKGYFYILWNYMIFFLVKELSMIGKIYMMKWRYRIYNKYLNLFYYICICFRVNCRIMINIVMKKNYISIWYVWK